MIITRPHGLIKPRLGTRLNAAHPLAQGLRGAWFFNEGSGLRVNDSSSFGHGGAINGNPIWRSGSHGQSLAFDGAGDYIDCGVRPALSPTSAVSVVVRWKTNGDYTTLQTLVTNGTDGNSTNYFLSFGFTDNKVEFWNDASGVGILASTASINTDAWRTVAATRQGATGSWDLKLYLDGLLDNSATSATNPDGGTLATFIGKYHVSVPTHYLNGSVDYVLVYGRCLSPSEVKDITLDPYQILEQSRSFAPLSTYPSDVKTKNGLARASIKAVNGLAIASVKTFQGLT